MYLYLRICFYKMFIMDIAFTIECPDQASGASALALRFSSLCKFDQINMKAPNQSS